MSGARKNIITKANAYKHMLVSKQKHTSEKPTYQVLDRVEPLLNKYKWEKKSGTS